MNAIKNYRLRKCSDVNTEDPYFEVLDESEAIVFDISKTNEGDLEILFYEGVLSKSIPISMFYEIVQAVKKEYD